MIYTREKIVLALNSKFGGIKNKTFLQKHIFLFINENKDDLENISSLYDFFPYYYGCFSFQLQKDQERLVKGHLLLDEITEESNNYIQNITNSLPKKILDLINNYYLKYKHISLDSLIRTIYHKYKYYTINSKIKDKYFTVDELNNYYKYQDDTKIFTLGYEGISIDTYINKLIKNNIKALIDVRANPYSRKYGFSKTFFENKLRNLKIEYVHIPELGIKGEERVDLDRKNKGTYDNLFQKYEKELKEKLFYVEKILSKLKVHNRIALTCFEKEVCCCHRGKISNYIERLGNYIVEHI